MVIVFDSLRGWWLVVDHLDEVVGSFDSASEAEAFLNSI
jgi:hypothetical protein